MLPTLSATRYKVFIKAQFVCLFYYFQCIIMFIVLLFILATIMNNKSGCGFNDRTDSNLLPTTLILGNPYFKFQEIF